MLPLLHIGEAAFPLYGLLVTLGYASGVLWIFRNLRHIQGTPGEFWALTYTLIFSALLGARLGFYAVEWRWLAEDPSGILMNWRTGWVFLPGFLAALAAGRVFQYFYNRLYRPRRYLQVADYFAPGLALGHAIGRIGCFVEGCCHGAATQLPWGIRFRHPDSSIDERLMGVPVHPTQLLEAAASLAIFILMWRHVLPGIRKKKYVFGTAFLGYLLLYSVVRFLLEFLRGDDRGFLFSPLLSPSQWLALAVILVAGAALTRNGIFERKAKARTIYLK